MKYLAIIILFILVAALAGYVGMPGASLDRRQPINGLTMATPATVSGLAVEDRQDARDPSAFKEADREYARTHSGRHGAEAGSSNEVVLAAQPSIPLAFAEPDSGMGLSDQQLVVLASIRQEFIKAVGGENQNPTDLQYRERWERAQPLSDAKVQAWLGQDVFSALEIRANAEKIRLALQGR